MTDNAIMMFIGCEFARIFPNNIGKTIAPIEAPIINMLESFPVTGISSSAYVKTEAKTEAIVIPNRLVPMTRMISGSKRCVPAATTPSPYTVTDSSLSVAGLDGTTRRRFHGSSEAGPDGGEQQHQLAHGDDIVDDGSLLERAHDAHQRHVQRGRREKKNQQRDSASPFLENAAG